MIADFAELYREKDNIIESKLIPTFDFIDVQFYESYSRSGVTDDHANCLSLGPKLITILIFYFIPLIFRVKHDKIFVTPSDHFEGYAMEELGVSFSEYIVNVYLHHLHTTPWIVQFSKDSEIPDQEVKFSISDQLVFGFGAKKLNEKMNYISPDEIERAWNDIQINQLKQPRGLMFWNLALEPDNVDDPHNMASRFNNILNTRSN